MKEIGLFNPQGDFYFNLIYVAQFIARMTLPCQGEKIQDLCLLSTKNNMVSWSHMICFTSMHFSQRLCLEKMKGILSSEMIAVNVIKSYGLNHHLSSVCVCVYAHACVFFLKEKVPSTLFLFLSHFLGRYYCISKIHLKKCITFFTK